MEELKFQVSVNGIVCTAAAHCLKNKWHNLSKAADFPLSIITDIYFNIILSIQSCRKTVSMMGKASLFFFSVLLVNVFNIKIHIFLHKHTIWKWQYVIHLLPKIIFTSIYQLNFHIMKM